MIQKKFVEIYVDGACKGNPGPGGWGAILSFNQCEKEIFGGLLNTTNNRMELTAVISAFLLLSQPYKVVIFTDSQYVQKGISEWIIYWKQKKWMTKAKTPVRNADLWKTLDVLRNKHTTYWHWIKGHVGNPKNERADKLANKAIKILLRHPNKNQDIQFSKNTD